MNGRRKSLSVTSPNSGPRLVLKRLLETLTDMGSSLLLSEAQVAKVGIRIKPIRQSAFPDGQDSLRKAQPLAFLMNSLDSYLVTRRQTKNVPCCWQGC